MRYLTRKRLISRLSKREIGHFERRKKRRDPGGSAKATRALATRQQAEEAEANAKQKAVHAPWQQYYARPDVWDEVADSYSIAADAWEEAGDKSKSLDMKWRMIRARRKGTRPEKAPSKERVFKIYKYHRRQGKTVKEAARSAKVQSTRKIVGYVGDSGWPDEDGGPVFRYSDGTYSVEFIQYAYGGMGRPKGYPCCIVYRVDLDREPLPDWIDARDVATYTGVSASILRKRWNSPRWRDRVDVLESVASFYGWNNFDGYPLELTRKEVQARYRRRMTRTSPDYSKSKRRSRSLVSRGGKRITRKRRGGRKT